MKVTSERARPRNQRVSNTRQRRQQHLLDVKVRSRTATQHRNRRVLVFISKIVLACAGCIGAYVGVKQGLQRLFFDNPDYRLSQIGVQTDGTLQRDQILRAADIHEGENIFGVNLGTVQKRLEELPQVDDVQVTRKMPAEIDIVIVERKPIAWITGEKQLSDPFTSDAAFLVDARGVLMKQKKLLPEYLGLPLIVGCAAEPLVSGKAVESFEARAALDLLKLSTRSFMQTRFQIREIDVSKGYCLLVTDKNHTQVTFGFDDFETQLQRLEQFLVYGADTNRELATVNLLVERNIPLTFAKPAAEVINETVDPNEEPLVMKEKVMKALPVSKPSATPAAPKAKPAPADGAPKLQRFNASPMPIRKALPVEHSGKDKT